MYTEIMELDEKGPLFSYISPEQRDLLREGFHLVEFVKTDSAKFTDYSFVVFPFAKAYEGFLKQVFLDAGFISQTDYSSKYFRVGKVLSPNLVRRLGKQSVYKQICDSVGCELGEEMWKTWRRGRNQVFHYFPHNLQSLDIQEAEAIISDTVSKEILRLRFYFLLAGPGRYGVLLVLYLSLLRPVKPSPRLPGLSYTVPLLY